MIKAAICEDDGNIRSYLAGLIRKQGLDCEITEYASGDDFLSGGEAYDLLFLDIELEGCPSGMDGMELARRIRGMELSRQPVIIFVTGYERFVYDAFDVEAFQYLLKPVDEQKFAEVFRRAAGHILSEVRPKALPLHYAGQNRLIPLAEIRYMESQGHRIVLHLKDSQLEYYARLGELEEQFKEQFCRIHKGYLVNLSQVEEYTRTEITLTGGEKLPVSKYKYRDFVKAYMHFMQSKLMYTADRRGY